MNVEKNQDYSIIERIFEEQLKNPARRKRIDWIDCAKGITILLVVIGHFDLGPLIRGAIFSFHMPLFFVLSCRTYKKAVNYKSYVENIKKSIKHLVVPLLVLWLCSIIIFILSNINSGEDISFLMSFILLKLRTLFWGSGVDLYNNGVHIFGFGMPYFLYVLFVGRSIYDFMQMKLSKGLLIIVVSLLSLVGVILGTVQWLPFSLDMSMAMQLFFWFGDKLRDVDLEKNGFRIFLISLLIWSGTLFLTCTIFKCHYFELAIRKYPIFPLSFITAIAGTIMVCEFSIFMRRYKKLFKWLCYIGENSMVMFCVHHFDFSYQFYKIFWDVTNNVYINMTLRVLIHLIVFYFVMYITKGIKQIRHGVTK